MAATMLCGQAAAQSTAPYSVQQSSSCVVSSHTHWGSNSQLGVQELQTLAVHILLSNTTNTSLAYRQWQFCRFVFQKNVEKVFVIHCFFQRPHSRYSLLCRPISISGTILDISVNVLLQEKQKWEGFHKYLTWHKHVDSDGWCHKPGTLPAKSLHPQGTEWPLGHPHRRKLASQSMTSTSTWTDLDSQCDPLSFSVFLSWFSIPELLSSGCDRLPFRRSVVKTCTAPCRLSDQSRSQSSPAVTGKPFVTHVYISPASASSRFRVGTSPAKNIAPLPPGLAHIGRTLQWPDIGYHDHRTWHGMDGMVTQAVTPWAHDPSFGI